MRKLLLPAAAICLCLSCAPPFDLGFSSSAVIIGKMTEESQLGPLGNYYTGQYSSTPLFYPERTAGGVDATRGFILTTDPGGSMAYLGFAASDGSGGYPSFIDYSTGGSLYHQDPSYPRFSMIPVKSGDFAALIDLDLLNTTGRSLTVLQATIASYSFTPIYTNPFTGLWALGAWVSPSPSASSPAYVLMYDNSTFMYHDGVATLDSTGLTTVGDLNGGLTLDFIPSGSTRMLYYHDPGANISYVSFSAGNSWQCWKWWWNAGIFTRVQLTSVTMRIDALLTTGELFSTQDGIGRVYDSNGKKVASFPLGNLKIAYEEYVNGTPRVFFSMPIPQDEGKLSLRVYSIPTSQLDSLSF